MSALYIREGKLYQACTCPARTGACPRGVERKLGTCELSRCLVPVPAEAVTVIVGISEP